MASKGSIQISHSDESLVAEIAFWANSAGYELVTLSGGADPTIAGNAAAVILELTGSSDAEVDVIEALTRKSAARVVAITELDAKTIASVRRLFQVKAVEVILLPRADFTTRQLADLLRTQNGQRMLDREGLAQAIADGHVVVHYQPKVPFRLGDTSFGVEALCRIQHPEIGMIYPDNFIPLAEAHDLIMELTDAVTVRAFRDLKSWDEAGRSLRLALNISPRLMSGMTWFELFEKRCQEYDIDPKRITLEVTESSSQGGKVLALEILSRLRLKGFLLSIDDFGTGFSSLETLYKLPFGELKIDKGFVLDLLKNNEARTLVESTVSLARKLGLKTVAEGVETDELFQELRNLQCDDAQGYFISKPIAADAVVPFFARWEADSFARANSPAKKLKAVHALLAELLSPPGDEEDSTLVLSTAPEGHAEGGREIAGRLPALILGGDLIGSLALVHKAVQAEPENEFRAKLRSLQKELERSLQESSLVLSDGRRAVQFLGGDSFTIGRDSSSAPADVTIPCRWASRGTKNLRLYRDKGRWMVADMGSTNGHFLDGVRLKPHEGVALEPGETVLEVGKTGSAPAPAWLRFSLTASDAVELTFGMANEDQTICASLKWILLHQDAGSHDGDVTALENGADFSNIAWRDGGLWLVPSAGATIKLAGHEFSQSLPLPAGCEVILGSAAWRADRTWPALTKTSRSAHTTAFA